MSASAWSSEDDLDVTLAPFHSGRLEVLVSSVQMLSKSQIYFYIIPLYDLLNLT